MERIINNKFENRKKNDNIIGEKYVTIVCSREGKERKK